MAGRAPAANPDPAVAANRRGARLAPILDIGPPGDFLHIGRLELRFDINRASWSGMPVDLTLTEFKIVALLGVQRTLTHWPESPAGRSG
jgi:DNA-binding response OmpR family regulator